MRFKPSCNRDQTNGFKEILDAQVEGTVVYVSPHGWYRCAYETPQGVQYECFRVGDAQL